MTWWLVLIACSGEPAPREKAAEPAKADAHAGHSDHMALMAKTRTELRATLGEAYDQPVPGLDAADPVAGKAVYDSSCTSCHGATGKGDGAAAATLDPKPADFTDAFHARYYSDAGRVHLIRKGSPGTGMPGFEGTLTEKDVLDVYAYVRSLRGAPDAGGEPHHH
jgi:mono/diheme cytochrome c family protein